MEESLLEVEVAGLKMRNPIILASGILGSYASSLNRISEHAGAVISKSVGVEEVEGYKNPVVVNYSHGIINAIGLSSPGAVKFAEELKAYKGSAPLIVSVFGSSPEDFVEVISHFPFASAFELNLSCPHSEKYGLTVGSDPDLVKEIVKNAKKATNKPVFAKISANVDVVEVGKAVEEGGADGIVAINTVKGMRIDIFTKKAILSNISGGVSGSAIKPIAIKCVWDLYEELEIPIIGSGGATTWRDIIEFMLAGASAVEVGSVLYYSLRAIYSLKESLIAYARMVNCKLEELIGAAHS